MRLIKTMLFSTLWTFVVLVEAYDIYLSVKVQEILGSLELNPIGRFLIDLDDGDIALFMSLKVAGILILLGSVPILYTLERTKLAWSFLGLIFISRAILLAYLQTGPWF